jgi:hypothetical protein
MTSANTIASISMCDVIDIAINTSSPASTQPIRQPTFADSNNNISNIDHTDSYSSNNKNNNNNNRSINAPAPIRTLAKQRHKRA